MSDIQVKVFAAPTADDLEYQANTWLKRHSINLLGFDFIADGLELSYNCMMLYRPQSPRKKS